MVKELIIRTDPRTSSSYHLLAMRVSAQTAIPLHRITSIRTLRRSIDARARNVQINLTLRIYVDEQPPSDEYPTISYPDVSDKPAVIVVGAGPAGLFASLRLIELGLKPILLERGKDVHDRRKDIAFISRQQTVNPESNYSFGEGGAGAYSDGKLYTRSTKRGNVDHILHVFCQHGADTAILSDVHPHIGTDRLPRVIERMRNTILQHGGEVYFRSRVEILLLSGNKVFGVITGDGREFQGPVILATGHSARDVYHMLYDSGILLQQKGLALGVRLEHPSHLVDSIMYHSVGGRGKYLPAAEYRIKATSQERGVYSFCMCPGGFVIPAATDSNQVVVNGMSPSGRNSKWSNSGIVVETRPEDLNDPSLFCLLPENISADHPLALMYLQQTLEYQCWLQANHTQKAPTQRMTDFVNYRLSAELPSVSYSPGVIASPLHFWMPQFISSRLSEAFKVFGRNFHGFLTSEASVLAVETRTSSPVRIPRHDEFLHHVILEGLYPCGEGAGYAGGIVSAAIDGERSAEAVKESLSL